MFSRILKQLRRGRTLAAPIPASRPDRAAFVGVYPVDPSASESQWTFRAHGVVVPPDATVVFRVRKFEIERARVRQDVWISEKDLHDKEDYFVFDADALRATLDQVGVNLEQLDLPHKSDYPI